MKQHDHALSLNRFLRSFGCCHICRAPFENLEKVVIEQLLPQAFWQKRISNKIFLIRLIFFKVCDIISMLHKLNIGISGIFVFMGILYPFFAIIIFELGKSASFTK